jgi:hypothetical protein
MIQAKVSAMSIQQEVKRPSRFGFGVAVFIGLAILFAAASPMWTQGIEAVKDAGTPIFGTINAPGAGAATYQGTAAYLMNAAGDVAGVIRDSKGDAHAFVRFANGTIVTFDAPGAGTNSNGTFPTGIDAVGDVAGIFADQHSVTHGFLRTAAGAISTFDVPGAGTSADLGTFPDVMDAAGDIAGAWADQNSVVHGFVRTANGQITTFDAPGKLFGTTALSINASGTIAGSYADKNKVVHAFVRTANGVITTFDAPDAGSSAYQGTVALGIDAGGKIAGAFVDANNVVHGFLRDANGLIGTFSAPGAGTTEGLGTYPIGIDASGDIAGIYADANDVPHGFVRAVSGVISTFDAPGASLAVVRAKAHPKPLDRLARRNKKIQFNPGNIEKYIDGTVATNIDAAGDVTGTYFDAEHSPHGFLRLTDGSITVFSAPEAGTDQYQGTAALGVTGAKAVVGTYADENTVFHGFIFTPKLTATTTTLTTSTQAAVYREPVTLTAKVSSGGGVPANGETVWFIEGSQALGSATTSDGTATLTTTALEFGTDSVKAIYGGDGNLAGSTSGAESITVTQAESFTSLIAAPNPSAYGQTVTFKATVTGQFGGTPTGKATFYYQNPLNNVIVPLGSESLNGGVATFKTAALFVGTGWITAGYSGGSYFAASGSTHVVQVVNKAKTNTVLTSTLNPSKFGQPVTLTAKVAGEFGGSPTGTVTYVYGIPNTALLLKLGTATLSKGTASLTLTALGLGEGWIQAQYSGDTNFDTSLSAILTQKVEAEPTTTVVVSSLDPSKSGQSVTFTATVTAKFAGTPTGSVAFNNGTTQLIVVPLSGGVAKFTTTALKVGKHTITAEYGGVNQFAGSSGTVTQTVN